ncbi:MAG: undecaprenyldiphospho-muramoylpentapeptide beta-N-acetylglucosaminyltransferase [Bacteroidetes bacterium]|nr:undecaprenyldiphospho-muramoylpentapeptide beta-N-acetylglucosaminyltransferase [Bacteroidota bacterium]
MSQYKPIKMIISGGGTGGHLFPAIAIAQKVMELSPESEVMFVGALGKIEMEKVPQYGYPIEGLNIAGIQRSNMLKNLSLPGKILGSIRKSKRIVKQFKPNIAVGVGGYASGPLLWVAERKGIPTLLQEQNSYPGITNKLLAGKAHKICVAFPGMEKFFKAKKLVLTGNPVRENLKPQSQAEALEKLGLDPNKKTILSIGGSLGARTINNAIEQRIDEIKAANVNFIWQTGKYYVAGIKERVTNVPDNIKISAFIDDMSTAYAAADLVISRAGALSISEITYLSKPSILVPSPNVAEDHQTKNAMVLVNEQAAKMVKDVDAVESLIPTALELLNDQVELNKLSEKANGLAKRNAAQEIAEEIFKAAHA